MDNDKKIALITGGSRGIGKGIVNRLKEDYIVIFTYHSSEKEAIELEKSHKNIEKAKCDISKEQDILSLIEHVNQKYGRLDVLINNAGEIIRPGDSGSDLSTWNKTIDVNLTGHWLLIKNAASLLKNSKNASIVNISSYVGKLGIQFVLPYGISKAGISNMTKAFAKELAPNIRVNEVSPGNIDTDMTKAADKDFLDQVIDSTPLKRLGSPEDIANVVAFLISDEASFITGVSIDVDGGYLLTH